MSSAVFPTQHLYATGLSKRELYALTILHAAVSANGYIDADYIERAVKHADLLVKRLEKN